MAHREDLLFRIRCLSDTFWIIAHLSASIDPHFHLHGDNANSTSNMFKVSLEFTLDVDTHGMLVGFLKGLPGCDGGQGSSFPTIKPLKAFPFVGTHVGDGEGPLRSIFHLTPPNLCWAIDYVKT